jgi:hypothetical protein
MTEIRKPNGEIIGQTDEDDIVVVAPEARFEPRPGQIQCSCGKALERWNLKADESGGEFICGCEKHASLGRLNVDVVGR